MKKIAIKNSQRDTRLTIRLTAEDKAELQRLRKLLSPYVPVSEGKAISAAIKIAVEKLVRS